MLPCWRRLEESCWYQALLIHCRSAGWPYQPGEVMTAQMNGFYAAAVTLLDGDAFVDQYAAARLADPAILALIAKISIVHDPGLDRGGAGKRHAVGIEALQADGTVL